MSQGKVSANEEYFRQVFSERANPFPDILGQENAKEQVKAALLMGRHVIIVGPPGVGKTTLARDVANLLPTLETYACEYHCDLSTPICPQCLSSKSERVQSEGGERFVRVQGSPDLTPEDLMGDIDPIKALEFGPRSIEAFTLGKLFKANNGVLFFDEINRCPQKLQNSLLQVLSEGKATIGSYDLDVPTSFIFIGTMNPEDASTEPLSDVFMDRFDFIHMGYPENDAIEKEIVLQHGKQLVTFPPSLLDGALEFIRYLRNHEDLERKPSVRASLGLYERAQAHAFLAKRSKVTAEDIALAVVSVISHRIKLKPNKQYLVTPEEFVRKEFLGFSDKLSTDQQGGHL